MAISRPYLVAMVVGCRFSVLPIVMKDWPACLSLTRYSISEEDSKRTGLGRGSCQSVVSPRLCALMTRLHSWPETEVHELISDTHSIDHEQEQTTSPSLLRLTLHLWKNLISPCQSRSNARSVCGPSLGGDPALYQSHSGKGRPFFVVE